jgi:predicted Zn finger-like uncharacterized protein
MKIECPHCRLAGQVSDASVPAEGRHMECPRCKTSFFVEKIVTASWADTLTDCPQCGYSNFSGERFDICPSCGLVAKDHAAQRSRQGGGRPVAGKAERPAGKPEAAVDSERLRQDLERLQRAEEQKHRLADVDAPVLPPGEPPVPEVLAVPAPVRYLGWAFVGAGLLALAWGFIGFAGYWKLTPAQAVASEYDEPPGRGMLYLTHGLLPTLQMLLGLCAAAAGSQFLKLRPWARKGAEAAVWGGIAYAAGCEVANLVAWVRRSSSSPSFAYYLAGVADALLMTAIWCAPLVVTILYLRGDTISEAFEE